MNKPLVSIITPSYNCVHFLPATAQSIVNQTYIDWEWIIVDDCSSDGTRDLIKTLAKNDNRIRYHFLESNKGAAVARNNAISLSKGSYLAFIDSDDMWHPEKLEKQIIFMEEKDLAFSFTEYQIMKEDGQITDKVVSVPEKIDYKGMLKNTIIGCLTVVINVEKIGKVEMPNIRTRQDMALWLSILKKGHIAYGLKEKLAYYRKVEGSISSNKLKAAKMNWKVYREVENLSLIFSSWCFVNYAFNAVKKTYIK